MTILKHYQRAFSTLKRGNTPGTKERAPHKPVLLLAVLDEIEAGSIAQNHIYITPELVARFRDVWSRYVTSLHFSPDFTKPFFHLKGEGFWHLKAYPGRELLVTASGSPKSFKSLKDSVRYAWLNEDLYRLLQQPVARRILRDTLLAAYFGGAAVSPGYSYISEVEAQLLHEAPAEYGQLTLSFSDEERVARGGVFKRLIPRLYNYACCISGMQVMAGTGIQMIDACHIVPIADDGLDLVTNGISLCPNLHRAFDRGLIRIDDTYRVVVSGAFTEREDAYSIRAFDGKRIALPPDEAYWPALENLERHWVRWEG